MSRLDEHIRNLRIGEPPNLVEGVLVHVASSKLIGTSNGKLANRVSMEGYGGYELTIPYWSHSWWHMRRFEKLRRISNELDPDTWFWVTGVTKVNSRSKEFFDYEFSPL